MPPTDLWSCVPAARAYANRVGPATLPLKTKRKRAEAQPRVAIRITRRYDLPPSRVFNAWLDAECAGRWLFATASQPMAHVEIDGRAGGSFCLVDRQAGKDIAYTGRYVEIIPHRELVFTLSMAPHSNVITRVTVAIAPRAKGCALSLLHENVPLDHANYVEGRWTGILYGLGVTLHSLSATIHHDEE